MYFQVKITNITRLELCIFKRKKGRILQNYTPVFHDKRYMTSHGGTLMNRSECGCEKKAAKNIPLQSSMLVQADEIRLGLPAARTQNEQNTMITSFHLLSFTFTFCHNMMWGCNKIDVIQTIAIFHSIL